VYRDCPSTLNELKTAITAYIRNISQEDLHKVFANKIERVQACRDARGHQFQSSNTFYKCTATFRTHCIISPSHNMALFSRETQNTNISFVEEKKNNEE